MAMLATTPGRKTQTCPALYLPSAAHHDSDRNPHNRVWRYPDGIRWRAGGIQNRGRGRTRITTRTRLMLFQPVC